ncbi:MAG: hypothetical protein KHY04_07400 [Bifidobacterium catenulatum]|nr:hypothetical protein [Bifidobacterium catenulatum]MBS5346144.1 hypothetical protein [Bifidobacterium catenulatum]
MADRRIILDGSAFGPAIKDRPSAGLNATFARPVGLAQAGALGQRTALSHKG